MKWFPNTALTSKQVGNINDVSSRLCMAYGAQNQRVSGVDYISNSDNGLGTCRLFKGEIITSDVKDSFTFIY